MGDKKSLSCFGFCLSMAGIQNHVLCYHNQFCSISNSFTQFFFIYISSVVLLTISFSWPLFLLDAVKSCAASNVMIKYEECKQHFWMHFYTFFVIG